jgi:hypothetical protein
MGHVAVAVSAADSAWGEELFVLHGGISEDKRALRCDTSWQRYTTGAAVLGLLLDFPFEICAAVGDKIPFCSMH